MAPSLGRLTERSEFLRVAAARRRWVAPGLILQAYERKPADGVRVPAEIVRLGLTASRKVGGAVERNRARRRLREAARRLLPAGAAPGYDLVLVARGETLRRPFAALLTDLATALGRLGIARGPEPDAKA
ncbi:MAG TPA: ribonuclease P protein component [Alphaproteobacteria bacterium]|nr:ribonuclease P protein component [Alphaproteobacteria bacterium]